VWLKVCPKLVLPENSSQCADVVIDALGCGSVLLGVDLILPDILSRDFIESLVSKHRSQMGDTASFDVMTFGLQRKSLL